MVKHVFVEVASEQMKDEGKKANISRLNVMTGIHRRDILRVLSGEPQPESTQGMVSRILGQWEQDSRFLTKNGKPRVLTYDGDDNQFQKLVSLITTDVHSGTVLNELERARMVERVPGGLKLVKTSAIVEGDVSKGYELLGEDVGALMSAVEENIFKRNATPNLHAITEYNNIIKSDIPKIRKWLLEQGSIFHRKARAYFSRFDKDLNPHVEKDGGGRVVLGTFSRMG